MGYDEYTEEFTQALVDVLLYEFPPTNRKALRQGGRLPKFIVLFERDDAPGQYEYYVAETMAEAVLECECHYPENDGWIINMSNGYRYVITTTVTVRPKPFDIITPTLSEPV